ncbi:MAG: hypothetical protein R2769_10575 [Saprospiraceae bacterium]
MKFEEYQDMAIIQICCFDLSEFQDMVLLTQGARYVIYSKIGDDTGIPMVLSIENGSTTVGSKVILTNPDGSDNQKFWFKNLRRDFNYKTSYS